MSTANKLTYLNQTKTLLKEAINNLGGDIDNETTFREYAEELDTIYSTLPKVIGEGTEVTLTPTLKGKLGIVEKGNSTQEGTPTPTTPIPIKSVTGNNNVVVNSANWFSSEMGIGGINADGTDNNNATTTIRTKNYMQVLPNTQYKLTNDKSYACYVYEYHYDSDTDTYTFLNAYTGAAYYQQCIFTTTANTTHIRARGITNQTDTTVKYMLNLGTTTQTWVAYQNQTLPLNLGTIELNKIGTYQDYIYKDNGKWYKHEVIKKLGLNDIQSWTYNSNSAVFYSSLDTRKPNTDITQNIYCDKLSWNGNYANLSGASAMGNLEIATNNNGTSKNIFIKNTDYTTETAFKNWLNTITPIIYYQLETATDIEITDTNLINQLEEIDKMKSYNGTTIITSTFNENNAQMIISGSALKNS